MSRAKSAQSASPSPTRAAAFTIGRLAQLTGFSTTVIRAWERRHALLKPVRLENGHRRYSAQDLSVLQNVRALLDEGSRIGDIARLGREELIQPRIDSSSSVGGPSLVSLAGADYLDGRQPEVAWSILEALPCAVIVTDKRGLVRWVNRGVATLCGYDLAELHGLKPGHLLQGPGTEQAAVERLRAAISNLRPASVSIRNYHKSGEPYQALVELAPLGIGANHAGFVATARRLSPDTGGGLRPRQTSRRI